MQDSFVNNVHVYHKRGRVKDVNGGNALARPFYNITRADVGEVQGLTSHLLDRQ